MIVFDDLTLTQEGPIYLQILRHVKKGLAAGTIRDGDELPSRRMLSTMLGVNPNTVQKAFALLEEEGLVSSRMGAKSCISLDESKLQAVRAELTEGCTQFAVEEFKKLGLTLEETLSLIRDAWEKEERA